jgi:hypothetical protein
MGCMEQSHLSGFCFFLLVLVCMQLETLLKGICDIIAFPHRYSQVTQHNTSAGEFLFWLTKHKIVSICCCCCCYVKKQTLSSPQLSIRFHKIYFPQIIC